MASPPPEHAYEAAAVKELEATRDSTLRLHGIHAFDVRVPR